MTGAHKRDAPEQHFTPGPWRVRSDGVVVDSSNKTLLVHLLWPFKQQHEMAGNLRLAAAAPDLLAMCEVLRAFFEREGATTFPEMQEALCNQLRDLIAGARGAP